MKGEKKKKETLLFLFLAPDEQMMKLSQDDTCATVYATFSRRGKKKKKKPSERHDLGLSRRGGWQAKITRTINLIFLGWKCRFDVSRYEKQELASIASQKNMGKPNDLRLLSRLSHW